MAGILGYAIIFLLTCLMVPVLGVDNVTEAFNKYRVVPDIIPIAPSALVKVVYPGDVEVMLGKELHPTQTLIEPVVDWEGDSNSFYTFVMFVVQQVVYPGNVEVVLGKELHPTQTLIEPVVDCEGESNSFYTFAMFGDSPLPGQFLHWLVGNIPGNDISKGQTLAAYFPPIPLTVTGLYRYVFLVYKQPDQIEFNTTLLNFTTTQLRVLFFMNDFAKKNELGNPESSSRHFIS